MKANTVFGLLLAAEAAVAHAYADEETSWIPPSSRPPLMQTPRHPSRFLASHMRWLASHTRRDVSPSEETPPLTTTNPWSLPVADEVDAVHVSSHGRHPVSETYTNHEVLVADRDAITTGAVAETTLIADDTATGTPVALDASPSSEVAASGMLTDHVYVISVGHFGTTTLLPVEPTPTSTSTFLAESSPTEPSSTESFPTDVYSFLSTSVVTIWSEVVMESTPEPSYSVETSFPKVAIPELAPEPTSTVETVWTDVAVPECTSVEVVITSMVPVEMESVEVYYTTWVPVEIPEGTTVVWVSNTASSSSSPTPSSSCPDVKVAIPAIPTASAGSSSIVAKASTVALASSVDTTSSTAALVGDSSIGKLSQVAATSSASGVQAAVSPVVSTNSSTVATSSARQKSNSNTTAAPKVEASSSAEAFSSNATVAVSSPRALASSSSAANSTRVVAAAQASSSVSASSSTIAPAAKATSSIVSFSAASNSSSVRVAAQTGNSVAANTSSNARVAASSSAPANISQALNASSIAALASSSAPAHASAAASKAAPKASPSVLADSSSSVDFRSVPWPSSSSSEYYWGSSSSSQYGCQSCVPSSTWVWVSSSEAPSSSWVWASSSETPSSYSWGHSYASSGVPYDVSSSGVPFGVSSSVSAPHWPVGTGHSWPYPTSSTHASSSPIRATGWSYPTPTHPASTPLVWGPSDLPHPPKPPCSYATDSYTSTEWVTVTPCKSYYPTCTQTWPTVSTSTSCVPTTYTVTATSSSYCPPEYYTTTWDITTTLTDHECHECWATPSTWTTPTTLCETYTVPPSFSWDFPSPTVTFNHTPTWAPPEYTTSTCWGYTVSTYESTSTKTWSLPAFVTVCPAASTPAPWAPPEYTAPPAPPVIWQNTTAPATVWTPVTPPAYTPITWNTTVTASIEPTPETYAPYTPEAPATWLISTYGTHTVVYTQPAQPVGETPVYPAALAPPVETTPYSAPPVESSPVPAPPPVEAPPSVEAPPPAESHSPAEASPPAAAPPPAAMPPQESSPVAVPPAPPVSSGSSVMERSSLTWMAVPLCLAVFFLWI